MNKNKNLAKILCTSMVIGNITPAFATVMNETNTYDDTTENVSKETEVLYQKAGNYFVTIPKTISLGADKQSPYSVKVEGDIPSDKQVYVSPLDGIKDTEAVDFYMHDTNTVNPKADVVATVTQNKFYWNFSEVANGYAETDNQVTAEDLTSGHWKGTFNFEINMKAYTGDESHTHSYTETIIKEPTCTEDGEKKLTCSCGDTKTETIPATGHNIINGSCTDCDVIVKTVTDLMAGGDLSFDMGTVLAVDKTDTLKVNDIVIPEQNFTFDKEGDYQVTVETTNSDGTPIIINITIIINQGSEHTHSYTETIIKAATCTESGEKNLTCSCGDTKTESIPATGHNYGADDKCTNCGELNPNHKHNYTETVIKEASCTESGEKQLTCSCGDAKTESIPATGHNYGADDKCTNCGELNPNHKHNYTETVIKAATCTEDGEKQLTCICGDSKTEVIEPSGHNYINNICSKCGLQQSEYGLSSQLTSNWTYSIDDVNKTVLLKTYIGNLSDVVIYSGYIYNGKIYNTVVDGNPRGDGKTLFYTSDSSTSKSTSITSVTFKPNVTATNLRHFFFKCSNLQSVNFNGNLNTSDITSMDGMFAYCYKLKSIDLYGLDTSNVTDMSSMFLSCTELRSVNLCGVNTENVQDMSNMFAYCNKLETITATKGLFKIPTSATNMFNNCGVSEITYLNN